jgi:hypothetical protein
LVDCPVVHQCAAQFPDRHGWHDQDLFVRRLRAQHAGSRHGDLLRSGAKSYAYAHTDGNGYCNSDRNSNTTDDTVTYTNGYANTDWKTYSDAASAPDTISASLSRRNPKLKSLCGNSRE